MKKHYRAIMLVFASENHELYKFMKRAWLTYHEHHPEIKVFFCYGAGSGLGSNPWDLCFEDLPESHVKGIKKVIRAMEYIDSNYTCDFLIRTNLSTFWDLDLLYERLKKLPLKGCLSGSKSNLPKINGGHFVLGYDMIFNGDSLSELVKMKEEILTIADHPIIESIAEDRILSLYLTDILKLSIIPSSKWACYFEHKNVERARDQETGKVNMEMIDDCIAKARERGHDHFRIKTFPDHIEPSLNKRIGVDDEIMRKLCRKYYGKEIL